VSHGKKIAQSQSLTSQWKRNEDDHAKATYGWTFVFPGVFITLFVLGWNLLGDAFRDILDPLYRRK